MSVVSLCRGLQGGEHVPAGSPRAGGGAHRGNSCSSNPNSCSAPGPKKSVGFPLPLKGPWSKVDLPCVPYRSVRALWDGRLTDSGKGKSISSGGGVCNIFFSRNRMCAKDRRLAGL